MLVLCCSRFGLSSLLLQTPPGLRLRRFGPLCACGLLLARHESSEKVPTAKFGTCPGSLVTTNTNTQTILKTGRAHLPRPLLSAPAPCSHHEQQARSHREVRQRCERGEPRGPPARCAARPLPSDDAPLPARGFVRAAGELSACALAAPPLLAGSRGPPRARPPRHATARPRPPPPTQTTSARGARATVRSSRTACMGWASAHAASGARTLPCCARSARTPPRAGAPWRACRRACSTWAPPATSTRWCRCSS